MKTVMKTLLLVVVLGLALPLPALAQTPDDTVSGRVVLGSSYTLRGNQTMDGDLVVLGGNAVLEEGSELDGSLLVMGGTAVVGGHIAKDVAVLGGNVDLLNPAVVDGDILSFGGNVDVAERATVGGSVLDEEGRDLPLGPRIGPIVSPDMPSFGFGRSLLLQLVWFMFRTLLLAALAVLVVMFWPEAAGRVATAVVEHPLPSGGLGVLTLLVGPLLLALLLITILLSPISLIGLLLLVVATVFGWIAVGLEVGNRIGEAMSWDIHAAAAAGLGTLLVTFVAGGLGFIPCIGWLAPFLVASLGLGGVLLTRFGSRPYEVVAPEAPEGSDS